MSLSKNILTSTKELFRDAAVRGIYGSGKDLLTIKPKPEKAREILLRFSDIDKEILDQVNDKQILRTYSKAARATRRAGLGRLGHLIAALGIVINTYQALDRFEILPWSEGNGQTEWQETPSSEPSAGFNTVGDVPGSNKGYTNLIFLAIFLGTFRGSSALRNSVAYRQQIARDNINGLANLNKSEPEVL